MTLRMYCLVQTGGDSRTSWGAITGKPIISWPCWLDLSYPRGHWSLSSL